MLGIFCTLRPVFSFWVTLYVMPCSENSSRRQKGMHAQVKVNIAHCYSCWRVTLAWVLNGCEISLYTRTESVGARRRLADSLGPCFGLSHCALTRAVAAATDPPPRLQCTWRASSAARWLARSLAEVEAIRASHDLRRQLRAVGRELRRGRLMEKGWSDGWAAPADITARAALAQDLPSSDDVAWRVINVSVLREPSLQQTYIPALAPHRQHSEAPCTVTRLLHAAWVALWPTSPLCI